MLSSNQITEFLDYQYLWEETTIVFVPADSNQGMIACNTATAGWVWPHMSSLAETYLDLPRVNLIGLEIVWPH